MPSASNVNSLVGATTRYIAGRNAMQTVYWRSAPGENGKMIKVHKNCNFDKSQKVPNSLRMQNHNQSYRSSA